MKRVSHAALFVSSIDTSRPYYETVLGLQAAEQMEIPSPLHGGRIKGLFMSCGEQHHDLLLIEQYDGEGNLTPPSDMGLHHLAFELPDDQSLDSFVEKLTENDITPTYGPIRHYEGPGGDGGAGGNRAVYFLDPDGHTIEVCRDMDPFTPLADAGAATADAESR
jgi:catechol 2,3-dioxygenase-like lactoylglutathione lyase family enzyme